MNLLTDDDIAEIARGKDDHRAIVHAAMDTLIARLARGVDVEPYDYNATDKAWAHTETTLQTAIALARVQALKECHKIRTTLVNPYGHCQVSAHAFDMTCSAYGKAIRDLMT